jgi:hypothetical protein
MAAELRRHWSWHPYMARAGPFRGIGPARFGSYWNCDVSISTAQVCATLPASEDVTAVTSYPSGTPSFFGLRVMAASSFTRRSQRRLFAVSLEHTRNCAVLLLASARL